MSTRYLSPQMDMAYATPASFEHFDGEASPIYQQVLSWLLLFPLLYHIANGQFSIFSTTNDALMTQEGNLLRTPQGIRPQIVLYLVVMMLFVLIGHQKVWRAAIHNKLILCGVAVGALSAIWSVSPMLTLRVSFMLGLTTLFAFYLSERLTTERLMRLLIFTATVAAILSLFLIFLMPKYGIYHRDAGSQWQGICSHKNTLGFSMAFLLTPIFFTSQRLALKIGYTAMLLLLIVMSGSRGAWFITAALFLFVGWLSLSRRLKSKEALLLSVATGLIVVSAIVVGAWYLEPLLRMIGKDPTLTGRTQIYTAVLHSIFTHPVIGYGLGAFWFGINPESLNIAREINWPGIGYAENGFLELALGVGGLGVGLVLLMFGRAIRQSAKLIRWGLYNPRVGWFSAIIFLELITNIEGGIVMAPDNLNWTLTLIAFIGLANEVRNGFEFA